MKYTAVITITEDVEQVYKCLLTEINEWERSLFTIKRDDEVLELHVKAKDATAFRATMNSLTQLLAVYEKMKGVR